jgi:hypothetical protein
MTQNSGPERQLEPRFEPGLQLVPAPGIHADFAASATLAASDEEGAAALIEIALGEGERFLDAQAGAPQDHDQGAQAAAVVVVAGGAHDDDDLLHLGRVGRMAEALVARRSTGVEAGHRCR